MSSVDAGSRSMIMSTGYVGVMPDETDLMIDLMVADSFQYFVQVRECKTLVLEIFCCLVGSLKIHFIFILRKVLF